MRIGRTGSNLRQVKPWSQEAADRVRNRPRQRGVIRWLGVNGKRYSDRKTAIRRGGGERLDLRLPRLVHGVGGDGRSD